MYKYKMSHQIRRWLATDAGKLSLSQRVEMMNAAPVTGGEYYLTRREFRDALEHYKQSLARDLANIAPELQAKAKMLSLKERHQLVTRSLGLKTSIDESPFNHKPMRIA